MSRDYKRTKGVYEMPLELRFSINGQSIGSLVITRTEPAIRLAPGEGVGTYVASLYMDNAVDGPRVVEGIKHIRADGAAWLVHRALTKLLYKGRQ